MAGFDRNRSWRSCIQLSANAENSIADLARSEGPQHGDRRCCRTVVLSSDAPCRTHNNKTPTWSNLARMDIRIARSAPPVYSRKSPGRIREIEVRPAAGLRE